METWNIVYGIQLRDYFAAMALQGLLAGRHDETAGRIVRRAYEYADAMLAVRTLETK